jgi:ribosomal-protein-alanine N-acetyltransferase
MAEQSTPVNPAFTDEQMNAPIPEPIFTTARLIIRPYHPQDAPSMTRSGNNPAVAKYMTNSFPNPYDLNAAISWISLNIDQTHVAHFGIFEASAPDVVIGGIGLNKLSTDVHAHTAEVGYWLAESHWGKGIMTEAVAGFTKWSFESFEGKDGQRMRKLYGGVYSGNVGSMRCFLKNGYAPEGVMKGHVEKNGETLDLHWFGLTKKDWEAR